MPRAAAHTALTRPHVYLHVRYLTPFDHSHIYVHVHYQTHARSPLCPIIILPLTYPHLYLHVRYVTPLTRSPLYFLWSCHLVAAGQFSF